MTLLGIILLGVGIWRVASAAGGFSVITGFYAVFAGGLAAIVGLMT